MSRKLVYLYLAVMLFFVALIQYSIYKGNQASGPAIEGEKKFRLLADKMKKNEADIRKSEANIRSVQINAEYDTMVAVPEGYFILGNNRSGDLSALPERKIFLSSFEIDKYEVTFAQFYRFVDQTGHRKPRLAGYLAVGSDSLPLLMNPFNPVVGVSWDDAFDYCAWKNKRLPTEAEWEKAAKGESRRRWPWGDEPNPMNGNFVGDKDGYFYTAPVGSFREDRSPYGVYDLAGNAMEWVNDWYREDAYQFAPASDPKGPPAGTLKVIRGASWNDSVQRGEATVRFKMSPEYRDVTIGFRCAKST